MERVLFGRVKRIIDHGCKDIIVVHALNLHTVAGYVQAGDEGLSTPVNESHLVGDEVCTLHREPQVGTVGIQEACPLQLEAHLHTREEGIDGGHWLELD